MDILIIRHGETDFNKNNIHQGQEFDPPLNQTGIIQATKTGLYLNNHLNGSKLDAIYCSPLTRTKQTAFIICDKIQFNKSQIIFDNRLLENREGIFAGKSESEIKLYINSHPELQNLISQYKNISDQITKNKKFFQYNKKVCQITKAEPFIDLMARSYNFICEIITHNYSKILIIGHNDILCAMLARIFNLFTWETPHFVFGKMVPDITNTWVCYIIYSKIQKKFIMVSLPSNIHLLLY